MYLRGENIKKFSINSHTSILTQRENRNPTSDILMRTPFRKVLEAEQPFLDVRHGVFSFVLCHSALCIGTISNKPYYIFVFHHHETCNFSLELLLLHISSGSLHCHGAILKISLGCRDDILVASTFNEL